MKRFYILLPLALIACSTPKTMLKNPKTGQIESCGGSATGSFVGGAIGYHVQKSNDEKCKSDLMQQGFKVIETEPATK